MKEEKEINEALGQLLDALEEQGRNARRQKQLCDLIDSLAAQEKTAKMPRKHRKLIPLWWAMGVSAACLLLWIILKPTGNQIENTEKPVFAAQIQSADSTIEEVKETAPMREPMMAQEPVVALDSVEGRKPINNKVKPKKELQSEVSDKTVLAEAKEAEPNKNVEVEPETTLIETPTEPLDEQTPSSKRKIIKSTKLVGYEMLDKKGRPKPKRSLLEDKTLFGQPQDPNMKDGMLAYEIKF